MTPLGSRLVAASGLAGRSTRTDLLRLIVACLLASVALFVLQHEILRGGVRSDAGIAAVRMLAAALPWIEAAAFLLFLWLAVRRFNDQDRPGWLAFLPWAAAAVALQAPVPGEVAFLIVAAFLVALFLPGTIGPNRYGPDPRGWRSPEHYEEERKQGRAR